MTITTRRNAARQFAVGAIGTPSKTARLLAHLPLDEQAKVVRWAGDARVVNAKMTRHDVTRTPDITDEDEVVWFTEEFAVTVPIERLGGLPGLHRLPRPDPLRRLHGEPPGPGRHAHLGRPVRRRQGLSRS